jgi:DNA polymerase-1
MKKETVKKLVLLDAHAIIHRAYHALPDFATKDGVPTGALFGVASMLMKIIVDLKPDYIVACYDLPEKTFRHIAYDEYKAGRKKADDALIAQINRSREIFQAFGIPMYDAPGFEADDILGTIVELTKKEKKLEVVIASGDMDTLQLIDGDRVTVYTLKKGINDTILYNEEAVKERFGFGPKLLPDYKALRGDPSDNIIGIAGIGEKTATILVNTFGSIESMYKVLKKDTQTFKDVGMTPRIISLLVEGEDEAEFSKTLATIRRDAPITFILEESEWQKNMNKVDVDQLFYSLEFKTLRTRFNTLFGDGQLEEEAKEAAIQQEVPKRKFEEAQIALWLLNSENGRPTLEDILAFGETNSFEEAYTQLLARIEKEELGYVFKEIELPIIDAVHRMQENGILVDVDYLKNLSKEYTKTLHELEKKINDLAGVEFNINSPKQLSDILFEKLALPKKGIKKSGTGMYSTRASELEKLRDIHPIISILFEYRELQKLLSTYIDTIPTFVAADGRLHAEFLQTGTTTGRFSSNNPNMQNIPIRTPLGQKIRNAFISPKGYSLVAIDYSQIELRITAILSGDEKLISIFRGGQDVHTGVAAQVFEVPESEVTKDMRRKAKVINFGIIYGMGVNALRSNLGSTREEAETFYNAYFEKFTGVANYLESTRQFAKKNGYTTTLFGRKRYFPGIQSKIPFIRAMAERMATNAPIQGTNADIVKIALRHIDHFLVSNKKTDIARVLLQVHDELVFEVRNDSLDSIIPFLVETMKNAIPKEFLTNYEAVPIEVGVSYGVNWGEMNPY